MDIQNTVDRACGISPGKAPVAESEIRLAREMLLTSHDFNAQSLESFLSHHSNAVLRDEFNGVQGCFYPECKNTAVWQRKFLRDVSTGTMLSIALAATTVAASPIKVLASPGANNFDLMRLVIAKDGKHTFALQFGCWNHLGGFVAHPTHGGKYQYDVVDAQLPNGQPHAIWSLQQETWDYLKVAERAQKMGMPEGSRAPCHACGLPFEHASGFGLRAGEGEDFWRVYCDYCGVEIQISDANV